MLCFRTMLEMSRFLETAILKSCIFKCAPILFSNASNISIFSYKNTWTQSRALWLLCAKCIYSFIMQWDGIIKVPFSKILITTAFRTGNYGRCVLMVFHCTLYDVMGFLHYCILHYNLHLINQSDNLVVG